MPPYNGLCYGTVAKYTNARKIRQGIGETFTTCMNCEACPAANYTYGACSGSACSGMEGAIKMLERAFYEGARHSTLAVPDDKKFGAHWSDGSSAETEGGGGARVLRQGAARGRGPAG